jgi:hypothetical protein
MAKASVAATTAAASVSAFAKASADRPALPAPGASFRGRRFDLPEGLVEIVAALLGLFLHFSF